jgi:hypothetical protein
MPGSMTEGRRMHRTGSTLLAVVLCATAVVGIALVTSAAPDPRPGLAVAAGPADPSAPRPVEPAPTPALDLDGLERSYAWQGPVSDVLSGLTADFPDDVAGAWLEGEVATVAFSGEAPAEAVERLRAMDRPFALQEGLGITELQLAEVSRAVADRALALAPGRNLASGASLRDRTISVDVGAPFDLERSGGADLGMDADELEDRLRAGVPAAGLAGFEIVATIDPSWSAAW